MKFVIKVVANGLGKLTYGLAAGAIGLMCVLVILDSASRTLGGGSVAAVFDVNETLIVVVAFVALAYAQLSGDHVSFTVVYDRLPVGTQRVLRVAGYSLALPLIAWMAWVTGESVIASWQAMETRMGVAQLPVWPARLAATVGLLGYVLVLFYGIIASFCGWKEYPLRDFAHGGAEDEPPGAL